MDINEFESTSMAGDFPEAVRRYLGLPSLEEIVDASNASGATRLLTCPPFEPFEALTLTFLDGEVRASHIVSDDDAWEHIACGEAPANDSQFFQREGTLSVSDLPTSMRDWRTVVEAITRAKSCMSDNPEGVSFFHLAFGDGVGSMCAWLNPTEAANPLQFRMVDGYGRIKARL